MSVGCTEIVVKEKASNWQSVAETGKANRTRRESEKKPSTAFNRNSHDLIEEKNEEEDWVMANGTWKQLEESYGPLLPCQDKDLLCLRTCCTDACGLLARARS
jgi:hypothetical protein